MIMDDDYDSDWPDDDGYCNCGVVHSIEEIDSGVCDACGGIVDD
jgi:hypothetical protein